MAVVGETYPIVTLLKSDTRTYVVGQKGEHIEVDKAVEGKVLGVYFSAHWCPPCRAFTPQLAKLYKELKEAGKPFEVIFVSSDRDAESFKEYFSEMPWLCVPFEDRATKQNLAKKFDVTGIPTLLVFDSKGKLIEDDNSAVVEQGAKAFPWLPSRVLTFGAAARHINGKKPCLFLCLETLPKQQQESASKDIADLGADAKNDDLVLATAYDSEATGRLRSYLGNQKPLMLMFHEGRKYIEEVPEYKQGAVQAFVAKYRSNSLKPTVKSAPRPANDADPAHPGITIVTANTFEELCLNKDKTMFLDVFADWCPPCRAVAPIISTIAKVLNELKVPNLLIGKFNSDDNDSDPKYLPETTIPTLKLFHRGQEPVVYRQGRDGASILTWLHDKVKGTDSAFDLTKAKERFEALKPKTQEDDDE